MHITEVVYMILGKFRSRLINVQNVKSYFLTFSNKVENRFCIRFICFSVCLNRPSSHKYSFNVLKLIYAIQIYYRMLRIENDVY